MIYSFGEEDKYPERLKMLLKTHKEIKFLSLLAVDFGNNHTDEKIPVESVIDDLEHFLRNGIQTDGSSNHLPTIATINNAKVDIIPDMDSQWIVDYNPQVPNQGTLIIPSFLKHNGKFVCSRSVLDRAVKSFKRRMLELVRKYPSMLSDVAEVSESESCEIEDVEITLATELEFWVKSPDTKTEIEKLSVSQSLKEQYWKKTKGAVRNALEAALLRMRDYDIQPEMGHKEVGGVSPKLAGMNVHTHVMEQLEIDWKYDRAKRTCDKELYVKDIVSDTFASYGLSVNFQAKPVEGVAGSGEHHHIGFAVKLKNGRRLNLFSAKEESRFFLSRFGYGALMGILNGYECINPFVSTCSDAFNRLRPGFEAPVSVVSSLGHSPKTPSRNRTVLVGLIKEIGSPLSTRFELRSPTASSNSYLLTAAMLQMAADGIEAVAASQKTMEEIAKGFDKRSGEEHFYLKRERQVRTEEDIFTKYSEKEREERFGKAPRTVYENLMQFEAANHIPLLYDDVFTEEIVRSYKAYMLEEWVNEVIGRIIPSNRSMIRKLTKLSDVEENALDRANWSAVLQMKHRLMKDDLERKSIFSSLIRAMHEENYPLASRLQVEMSQTMQTLTQAYSKYRTNLIYESR